MHNFQRSPHEWRHLYRNRENIPFKIKNLDSNKLIRKSERSFWTEILIFYKEQGWYQFIDVLKQIKMKIMLFKSESKTDERSTFINLEMCLLMLHICLNLLRIFMFINFSDYIKMTSLANPLLQYYFYSKCINDETFFTDNLF